MDGVAGLYCRWVIKSYQFASYSESPQYLGMLLHEVTGRQLRDAREALGLSLAGLAARAGINRVCIRIYEAHGDETPNAHTHVLGRLTRYLQDQGIEFHPDGSVHLDRAEPTMKSASLNDGVAA